MLVDWLEVQRSLLTLAPSPATPVIAWLSERYHLRRPLLLSGFVALMGSQVLLMETSTYWLWWCPCTARHKFVCGLGRRTSFIVSSPLNGYPRCQG